MLRTTGVFRMEEDGPQPILAYEEVNFHVEQLVRFQQAGHPTTKQGYSFLLQHLGPAGLIVPSARPKTIAAGVTAMNVRHARLTRDIERLNGPQPSDEPPAWEQPRPVARAARPQQVPHLAALHPLVRRGQVHEIPRAAVKVNQNLLHRMLADSHHDAGHNDQALVAAAAAACHPSLESCEHQQRQAPHAWAPHGQRPQQGMGQHAQAPPRTSAVHHPPRINA